MIKWIFIFLAGIEDKVIKFKPDKKDSKNKNTDYSNTHNKSKIIKFMPEADVVEKEYKQLKKEYKQIKENAPEPPSLGQRVKATFTNVKNVAKNAIDNTIGYGIAKYQNNKTRKHFKKNPGSDNQIGYLMHGLMQNEGSQWRLARQLRKEGHQPYHLKGHHSLSREKDVQKAYEQIKEFHKYSGIKNPEKRNDYFSGHSTGGDIGIYMAGDKRAKQHGIKYIQARAPAPSGIEAKTLGQKILMPIATEDNVNTYKGRKNAVELDKRKPQIPVEIVAGRYDNLVPPSDTAYKFAKKHYIIDHPDSTHFGTSGVNKEMNNIIIDLIKKQNQKYQDNYQQAA